MDNLVELMPEFICELVCSEDLKKSAEFQTTTRNTF